MWDFGYFQGLPDTDPKAPAIVLSNWWCVLIAFAAGTTFYLLYDQTEKVKAVRMIVLFRQHVPAGRCSQLKLLEQPVNLCVVCGGVSGWHVPEIKLTRAVWGRAGAEE